MSLLQDTIGLPDLTLLDEVDEEKIMGNLKDRFMNGKIYTSVGEVIVSINPYKKFDIYGDDFVAEYKGKNLYELPPHIFSIADSAFRNMRDKSQDQCVIITGESGAGKTEASKIIMRYIAAVSSNATAVEKIKEQLLQSNPCLEALGNAKTVRNDNSSRFGKYMDLQFNYRGDPVGGNITTYLLEKARIIQQTEGERSFHIFYQLIRGADDELRGLLHLKDQPKEYNYLAGSHCDELDGVDDKSEFEIVRKSLKLIGIGEKEEIQLYEVVAAVLHLGNINLSPKEEGGSIISDEKSALALKYASDLLGITEESLLTILTTRIVKDMNKKGDGGFKVALEVGKAENTRDALAKSLYDRFFKWFVKRINSKLNHGGTDRTSLIGVLDIYGFEVFKKNGFEQFCINYCNERLQQLFIDLTLKSEQEEYAREGLTWTHIEYFNNAVICELIETKPRGIIALLDEECFRPGDVTDMTFLDKLNQNVIKHPHYDSREKSFKTDHTLENDMFRLKHYAGDVAYNVDGFVEKNTDLLSRDVLYALNASTKTAINEVFPENASKGDFKRPDTIGSQFRSSIQQLMESLRLKNPHYLRCVKPNATKTPDLFEDQLVMHQCRYLGLVENIRVRRAGYCYRQRFDVFVERYKMLSKDTWPKPKDVIQKAVISIMESSGLSGAEYAIGGSKIFIRDPKTLFQLESKREAQTHKLVSKIRATYLAWNTKQKFKKMKSSAVKIQATFKMHAERKRYKRKISLCVILTKLARGFIQRKRYKLMLARQPKKAIPIIQKFWLRHVRRDYILFGVKEAVIAAGPEWRKVKWPVGSPCTKFVSSQLKKLYVTIMARKYRKSLTPERKALLEIKAAASGFCEKKKGYKSTIPCDFPGDHIGLTEAPYAKKWNKINTAQEKVVFAATLEKRHRKNPNSSAGKILVLTQSTVYFLESRSLSIKEKFDLSDLQGISFSPFTDSFFVLHRRNSAKGDCFYELQTLSVLIELVGTISVLVRRKGRATVNIACAESHQINVKNNTMRIKFMEDKEVDRTLVHIEKDVVYVAVPTK